MRTYIFLLGSFLLLSAQENVGIGTAIPIFNMHVEVPYSVAISSAGNAGIGVVSDMIADGIQSDIAFHLTNTALSNGPFFSFSKWSFWMADPNGGYGVIANSWEIWEYPPSSGNQCCRHRFRVLAGSTAAGPAYVDANQEVYAYGFITYSDARLKQSIYPFPKGLESLSALRPVRYTWKDNNVERIGFIAQEVGDALPQARIFTTDSLQGVDYIALTAVLVNAVQELSHKLSLLEKKKQELEALYQARQKNLSLPPKQPGE
ncbi:MAG: tail fiber domain-containing protein [Bacteroidia bacterium]|nr:tail fiber domain-containing protein [Bacteroidia bacterium]MDW8134146.1 tail fiber domain-containing protein [Bacteroidia bacterium]